MAFNAAMVWEARTSGSNNNGGGWYDAGGASADYSQQDAAQLSLSDVVTDGTTTVTSVTGGFTSAMVGSIINVLTKGRRQITVRTDTNTITVDATLTAGSGLTGNVGGAVADLEEIDSIVVAGNTVHFAAGTYNVGGAISFANGSFSNIIKIRGYNSSRGDEPREDDRPLLAMGANAFVTGEYNEASGFRETSTATYGFQTGYSGLNRNIKVTHTGGTAAFFGTNATSRFVDCEADITTGIGFLTNGENSVFIQCYAHGSGSEGWESDGSGITLVQCIASGFTRGIHFDNGSDGLIFSCTIDGNTIGIDLETARETFLMIGNQFTNNTTGVTAGNTTYQYFNRLEYNNWYGNGTDVNNIAKGQRATANDPGYANQPSEDFSEVDDLIELAMRLGVGV